MSRSLPLRPICRALLFAVAITSGCGEDSTSLPHEEVEVRAGKDKPKDFCPDGLPVIQAVEGVPTIGTDVAECILGTKQDDFIDGRGGDDFIFGDAGIDDLLGGDGDDVLRGAGDNDRLQGGQGNDDLDGGDGPDLLYGGDGNDRLTDEDNKTGDELLGEGDDDIVNSDSDPVDGGPGLADICSSPVSQVNCEGDAGSDPGAGCKTDAECDDGDPCTGIDYCLIPEGKNKGTCEFDLPPLQRWFRDLDDDAFGDDLDFIDMCAFAPSPVGYVLEPGDCDDQDPTVRPDAPDAFCDGIDDDCDGANDEDFVPATTGCGIGACAAAGATSCVDGAILDSCSPGAPAPTDATCDGVDDDCNGITDEGYAPQPTSCGQGLCAAQGETSCVGGAVQDSCIPAPALEELCDGLDNDCDGVVDNGCELLAIDIEPPTLNVIEAGTTDFRAHGYYRSNPRQAVDLTAVVQWTITPFGAPLPPGGGGDTDSGTGGETTASGTGTSATDSGGTYGSYGSGASGASGTDTDTGSGTGGGGGDPGSAEEFDALGSDGVWDLILTGGDKADATVSAELVGVTGTAEMRVWSQPLYDQIDSLQIAIDGSWNMSHGDCRGVQLLANYAGGDVEDVTHVARWVTNGLQGRMVGTDLFAGIGSGTNSYTTLSGELVPGTLAPAGTTFGVWGGLFGSACPDERVPGELWDITLTPAFANVFVGEAQFFQAAGYYADRSSRNISDEVTWLDDAIGTSEVSPDGYATGLMVGTGQILAEAEGQIGTADLTLVDTPALGQMEELWIEPPAANVPVGASYQLKAFARFSGGQGSIVNVTDSAVWQSSDATVTDIAAGDGIASTLGLETILVTADGFEAEANVRIWDPARLDAITGLTLATPIPHMSHGSCQQLGFVAQFNGDPSDTEDLYQSTVWRHYNPRRGSTDRTGFFFADGQYTDGYEQVGASLGRGLYNESRVFIGVWGPRWAGVCEGIDAQETITDAGGVVRGPGDSWELVVPPGALNPGDSVELTVTQGVDAPGPIPEGFAVRGGVYQFEPTGLVFNVPVEFRVRYPQGALPEGGLEEHLLAFYYLNSDGSVGVTEASFDSGTNEAVVQLPHFSFGAFLDALIRSVNDGSVTAAAAVQSIADLVATHLASPPTGVTSQEYYADNAALLDPFIDRVEAILGPAAVDALLPTGVEGCPPSTPCPSANPCADVTCQSGYGCQPPVDRPDGSACDLACTTGESCQAGACVGTPVDCSGLATACQTAACDPALDACQVAALPDGSACDDADACTADRCESGSCVGHPIDCSSLTDACNTGICNTVGACIAQPRADGTSCADGDVCNGDEVCAVGSCAAGAPLSCDDGQFCNGDETCDPATGCIAGSPPPVDDGVACTADSCDEAADVVNHIPDDAVCDDGDACTVNDRCELGVGCGSAPRNCEDANPCTADDCDPATGCVNYPVADGSVCAPGDACNAASTCSGGGCQVGDPVDCDDGNDCTSDDCDPAVGCDNQPVADLQWCDGGTGVCLDGDCANSPIERVSVDDVNTQVTGTYGSLYPIAVSENGRFVAWISNANHASGGADGRFHVFLRDRELQTTTLVDRGLAGTPANGDAAWPSISGDGTRVSYSSSAPDLVPNDSNATTDVFVHDVATGTTTRASVSSTGAQATRGGDEPSVSKDGSRIAFTSESGNLPGANGQLQIYVHDLSSGVTELASRNTVGAAGNRMSVTPTLSYDGRMVAFVSLATDLVSGDGNGVEDVFVRNLDTAETTLVSVAVSGQSGNAGSPPEPPVFSGSSELVVFRSTATDLVAGGTTGQHLFARNLTSLETTVVSANEAGVPGDGSSASPSISADGRFVAFHTTSPNMGVATGTGEVVVKDLVSGGLEIASKAPDGSLSGNGLAPTVSEDGVHVAFLSQVDFIDPDTNGSGDIFVTFNPLAANPCPYGEFAENQFVPGTVLVAHDRPGGQHAISAVAASGRIGDPFGLEASDEFRAHLAIVDGLLYRSKGTYLEVIDRYTPDRQFVDEIAIHWTGEFTVNEITADRTGDNLVFSTLGGGTNVVRQYDPRTGSRVDLVTLSYNGTAGVQDLYTGGPANDIFAVSATSPTVGPYRGARIDDALNVSWYDSTRLDVTFTTDFGSIAADPNTGDVYVATGDLVVHFAPDGTYLGDFPYSDLKPSVEVTPDGSLLLGGWFTGGITAHDPTGTQVGALDVPDSDRIIDILVVPGTPPWFCPDAPGATAMMATPEEAPSELSAESVPDAEDSDGGTDGADTGDGPESQTETHDMQSCATGGSPSRPRAILGVLLLLALRRRRRVARH